jgi:hypothetical protein
MKSFLTRLVFALVFFALGGAFLTASRLERRTAAAHQMLEMLRYAEPASEYDDIEQSVGYVSRVPWLTTALLSDVRAHHETADYWQAKYESLTPERDATGGLVEHDPHRLFLAANAAFRGAQRATADRAGIVRQLDEVLKGYVDVLKNSAGHLDAAYNFEYVARLRDSVVRARGTAVKLQPSTEEGGASGDLPAGPTLHGHPGAPPPGVSMAQFKMVVPMRPDERKEQPEAGRGPAKVRKG